jgi:hypothetical protein
MPPSHIAYLLAVILCVGSVARYGGRDEWRALAGVIGASVVTPLLQRHGFQSIEYGIMAVDLALLAWLTAIALQSDRRWPLFAAGFHLAGCAVHLAPLAGANFNRMAYSYASAGSAYFVLLAIAVGTFVELRGAREGLDHAPKG